ncbi:MAG: hypothetical protein ACK5MA_00690 [Parachlamydiaceae bacterium]
MESSLESLLMDWPLSVIRDVDVATAVSGSASRRYAIINRALHKGNIISLRRGLYLIGKPYRRGSPSSFEIAHTLYGPSYISFESALAYHQWIPEAVYITVSATSKRANAFETILGRFEYVHVPVKLFYLGVKRVGSDDEAFLMADPWKAVADHYYVYGRDWKTPADLTADMRIERESMLESDLSSLKALAESYQSSRVRKFLNQMLRGLQDGN